MPDLHFGCGGSQHTPESAETAVEAAWALANLAGADGAAVLPAAPALIEHLGGFGGLALAELCAWTLGSLTSARRCQCKQAGWAGRVCGLCCRGAERLHAECARNAPPGPGRSLARWPMHACLGVTSRMCVASSLLSYPSLHRPAISQKRQQQAAWAHAGNVAGEGAQACATLVANGAVRPLAATLLSQARALAGPGLGSAPGLGSGPGARSLAAAAAPAPAAAAAAARTAAWALANLARQPGSGAGGQLLADAAAPEGLAQVVGWGAAAVGGGPPPALPGGAAVPGADAVAGVAAGAGEGAGRQPDSDARGIAAEELLGVAAEVAWLLAALAAGHAAHGAPPQCMHFCFLKRVRCCKRRTVWQSMRLQGARVLARDVTRGGFGHQLCRSVRRTARSEGRGRRPAGAPGADLSGGARGAQPTG